MSGTDTTATHERYRGTPAEIYEQHFVPAIGRPCATPVVDRADPRPGERVLDVACGTGIAARLATERVGPTGAVVGIDGHPGMLEVARSTAADIEWRQASADGLPFDDASFDVALCSLGLQFFADKTRALAEMARVLTPGGRVGLGVPGPTPDLFVILHDVLARHLDADVAAFVHGVFSLHDETELRGLMDGADLRNTTIKARRVRLALPAPADFLWQYLLGTPLAMSVADLDDDARGALEHDVVERWQPFVGPDGLAIDVRLLLATATATGESR